MAIPEHHIDNLKTIRVAAMQKHLSVVRCKDKLGKEAFVVAAAFVNEEGEYRMVPLAKMFDDDPYEELDPPTTFEAIRLENQEKEE